MDHPKQALESANRDLIAMPKNSPSDLADLITMEPHKLADADLLQFDFRKWTKAFPTPKAEDIDYDLPPPKEDDLDVMARTVIDVLRLTFQVGQIEQFGHDQYPIDFEPVRSPSALAFNEWRKAIVMQKGCERLYWGICDQTHSDTIMLFICKILCPYNLIPSSLTTYSGWSDVSAQATRQKLVTIVPKSLTDLLCLEPEIFQLPPMPSRQYETSNRSSKLEITFFHCPISISDRRQFEHYYRSFTR